MPRAVFTEAPCAHVIRLLNLSPPNQAVADAASASTINTTLTLVVTFPLCLTTPFGLDLT